MEQLKKEELVSYVAEKANITKVETRLILGLAAECMVNAVAKEKSVDCLGLGKFTVVHTKPKECKNPKTGEPLRVPEKRKLKFNPSSHLKEILNPGNIVKTEGDVHD